MEAIVESVVPVEVQKKIQETEALSTAYAGYSIDCPEKYQASAADLKLIKTKFKELTDTRMSLTRPIEESKKRIIALFQRPLDFLSQAELSIKKAMVGWQTEQERIRRAEQARLDEIQRKEAEKLRQQAEKEAARAESLKTEKGQAAALAKAEELKAKAEVVTSITPTVESKVEEVEGVSTRKIWKFKIVDVNKIPREYLIPDEKYIGQIVRASKGKKLIEGIEIYSEDVISSRT